MTALLIVLAAIVLLFTGYVFYGSWLAKQWGIDPTKKTPAIEKEDGVDYVAAKPAVLMGHHFSSIAGAGPINGPIQAAVFGWVPVLLWVLIGGIFFGGVHDYGALFASLRHKGQSIGEVIADTMGSKAKKLFIVFAYLTLILVVAAFGSIVANTFKAAYTESGAVDVAASSANATTAMISILFIVLAVVFGFMVYRRNVSLGVSTIAGVAAIVVCVVVGLNFHPIYLSETAWMVIVGIYITVASVAPVWILLQPRDYLSSFLLYFMMIVAAVGVIGSALMGHASLDIPAFTGFKDTLAPTGSSLGFMFPALFVTIACGAISGFHSLVGSGTTSKQLDNEKNARPIAYGGMLIECALAIVSLCAVGYIWSRYADGTTVVPTAVFATGISEMTTSLSRLLKSISKGTSLLIDIREELSLLENYFTIQSYRYGGTITMDIQVDNESLYNSEIIKFTLQPLVENAIFHGIEPKGCAGHIRIHVGYETSDNTEKIRIDVTDDGVGMTADKAAQVLRSNDDSSADFFREIGVSNVHKRLQYQFGAEYGITIESKEGEYTTMSIHIPNIPLHNNETVSSETISSENT